MNFFRIQREYTSTLASKEDIWVLKDETKTDASLQRNLAESKYNLLKWIFIAQIAVSSLAVAIIKLF